MSSISVKDLADELEVSKQAIHKRIKQLPPNLKPTLVKGAYKLSVETADYIRAEVQPTTNDNPSVNQPVDYSVNNQSTHGNQSFTKETVDSDYVNLKQPGTTGEESKYTQSTTDNQPVDEEVDAVKLLVEQKDNEINRLADELSEKNKQINKLQSLLDQQQQLALQTQLQNNKLQLQLEEVEEKAEADKKIMSDSKQTKKKWWHFFNNL